MRFYKLDDVPVRRDDVVFKESPIFPAILALLFLGIGLTAILCGVTNRPFHMPLLFGCCFGGFFVLFGLIPLSSFRASLKPTNWLMRCQPGCLFLKYRAFENWRLPADTLQVAGIEFGEIASAKLVKERRTSPNTDGKGGFQVEWITYIDLSMINPDLSELDANLQSERALRPTTGMKIVTLDFPVQVLPGGVIEIRWNSGFRPSAKKALQLIGQRVKILDPEHRKTDLTHRPGANPEQEKAKIIALARNGDNFGAIRLAQQVYGYNLTQATEFVGKLARMG